MTPPRPRTRTRLALLLLWSVLLNGETAGLIYLLDRWLILRPAPGWTPLGLPGWTVFGLPGWTVLGLAVLVLMNLGWADMVSRDLPLLRGGGLIQIVINLLGLTWVAVAVEALLYPHLSNDLTFQRLALACSLAALMMAVICCQAYYERRTPRALPEWRVEAVTALRRLTRGDLALTLALLTVSILALALLALHWMDTTWSGRAGMLALVGFIGGMANVFNLYRRAKPARG